MFLNNIYRRLIMPLVRIALMKGKHENFGKRVGDVVYRAMIEKLNVPLNDNFQIISEHDINTLVYDPAYLDIGRSDAIVIIQITLNEGRTVELKKLFFEFLADKLYDELGIRKEDIFVNLLEVKKENWSFGCGVAQYA